MKQVLQQFCFDGEPVACELFGNGHINRTYRVICENGKEYILQRVSQVAFHHPERRRHGAYRPQAGAAPADAASDRNEGRKKVLHRAGR